MHKKAKVLYALDAIRNPFSESTREEETLVLNAAEAWATDTESIDVREIKRIAWNEGAQATYNSFENTGIGYKFRHVKNPYND